MYLLHLQLQLRRSDRVPCRLRCYRWRRFFFLLKLVKNDEPIFKRSWMRYNCSYLNRLVLTPLWWLMLGFGDCPTSYKIETRIESEISQLKPKYVRAKL